MNTVRIVISNTPTGKKALLYEYVGKKGRKKYVPTYKAIATSSSREVFEFAVVRDSSSLVFGHTTGRFEKDGECPPSRRRRPYLGIIREDGSTGFRIEFFESRKTRTLRGTTGIPRENLQIHFGPAASHGCFLVAGSRRRYHQEFVPEMRRLLGGEGFKIEVIVLPK